MSVFYNCSFVFCHLMPSFSTDHRWINVRGGNADVMKVHLGKRANVGRPTAREKQMHAAPLNLCVRCCTSGRDEESETHSLSMMSLRANERAQWHSQAFKLHPHTPASVHGSPHGRAASHFHHAASLLLRDATATRRCCSWLSARASAFPVACQRLWARDL